MGLKIANDVPQKLLDLFNNIDFSKISSQDSEIALERIGTLTNFVPLKNENTPKPIAKETKNVSKDFPQRLLDIFNKIDWSSVDNSRLTMGVSFLKPFINKLPQKSKN